MQDLDLAGQGHEHRGTGACSLLQHLRLRWLGHVHRMADGRIPKDLLYGELVTGTRSTGRPYLRYKDTCKCDMKMAGIDKNSWESRSLEADCSEWHKKAEHKRSTPLAEKRDQRK